ncbi:MAG: M28 family peptidase [Planctomycetota bacterium]
MTSKRICRSPLGFLIVLIASFPAVGSPGIIRAKDLIQDQEAVLPAASTKKLRADLEYLASEELRGRGAETEQIQIAANFIAKRMFDIGLKMDWFNGEPFQQVSIPLEPIAGSAEKNSISLEFEKPFRSAIPIPSKGQNGSLRGDLGVDYGPMAIGTDTGSYSGKLAFVGYGITATRLPGGQRYDDYANIDVEGKAVIILRKQPRRGDVASPFGRDGRSRHAFFAVKVSNAINHGAAAILFVNDIGGQEKELEKVETSLLAETKRRESLTERLESLPAEATNIRLAVKSQIEGIDQMIAASKSQTEEANRALLSTNQAGIRKFGKTESGEVIPIASISRTLLNRILIESGARGLTETEQAIDRTFAPLSFDIPAAVTFSVQMTKSSKDSPNVVGVIEGKGELAQETVVLGAHFDHVGMGGYGSLAPNTIAVHNGADDNASGTSALLGVAEIIKQRLQDLDQHRRVVFIAFTGEERGLLGSRHYVAHPRFPLESTVAMVNLDMVGRLRENNLTIYGTGTAKEFDSLIDRLNVRMGFELNRVPSGNGPSDHQSFYDAGIPVLFFFTGLHNDYHRPTDDSDKIDYAGLTRITDTTGELVFELATTSEPPTPESSRAVNSPRAKVYVGVSFNGTSGNIEIRSVEDGSPAEQASIQPGDRLVRIDGKPINELEDVFSSLAGRQVGESLPVEVFRDNQPITLTVKLGARP